MLLVKMKIIKKEGSNMYLELVISEERVPFHIILKQSLLFLNHS